MLTSHHVTCHTQKVVKTYNIYRYIYIYSFFWDKVVELVGWGLLSTGPTLFSFYISKHVGRVVAQATWTDSLSILYGVQSLIDPFHLLEQIRLAA